MNDYTYDLLGNLTQKTEDGVSMTLGYSGQGQYTNNAGPHAVTTANGWSYTYDKTGNLTSATKSGQPTKTVAYSPFNTPTQITWGSKTSTLVYGPNQDRIKHSDSNGRVTTYIGGVYEEVTKGGVTYYIHRIGEIGQMVSNGDHSSATINYKYTHRDQLGSIVAVTGKTLSSAADIKRQSNGAWGERRYQQWNGPQDNALIPQTSARGFTDHEHMDAVGLIHMNGRVYDPELGRFLSADPIIQSPYNTQSYNRYSYVFNNPLSFTDPSGFTSCGGSGYSANTSCAAVDETLIIGSREQAMAEIQRQALANANYDYLRSFSGQQSNIQMVMQQSLIDSYANTLVGMAMQNGGAYQWNGYVINASSTTANYLGIAETVIAYMGGGDYFSGKGLKGIAANRNEKFFMHFQTRKLSKWIDQQHAAGKLVRIVGHSWGADSAMGIVASGKKVDSLVTVDPVGWLRPDLYKVAANTRWWENWDSDSKGLSILGGDLASLIGRRYNDAPAGIADAHFNETGLNHADVCGFYCN